MLQDRQRDTLSFLFHSIPHSLIHSVISLQHHKKVPRRAARRRAFLYFAGVLLAKSSHVKTDRDKKRDAEETEESKNVWKNAKKDSVSLIST